MLGSSTTHFPKLPPNLKGIKRTRTSNTTSLGIDCLDKLIEDGIPFPSIVLIDERNSKKYSKMLARLFVAEGFKTGQELMVVGTKKDTDELLESVPVEMTAAPTSASTSKPKLNEDPMKIAWRYNTAPQVAQMSMQEKFDLAKSLPKDTLDSSGLIQVYNGRNGQMNYDDLYSDLGKALKDQRFDVLSNSATSVLRFCVQDLATPLISGYSGDSLLAFLVRFKSRLMTCSAVAMVTLDGNLVDPECLKTIYSLVDTVFVFHSNVADSGTGGRMEIAKYPRCYGLVPFKRENCDFVYKTGRRTIEFRKLHLDPEGVDDAKVADDEPILPKLKELGVLATE
uniref:Elongator complex protein 4 n=1 Tax=Panagrolaimus sp. JU765 TaxID=591449 RepID=A0AC34QAT1_9BILA